MTTPTKIWFDTEFIEDGKTIDLISIGLVREDGAELYLESADCNWRKASEWVLHNVHPHLSGEQTPRGEIAEKVRAFAGEKPEFWAYYADYDWVVLCQLYGTMMELPKGWPMYCRDLKQTMDDLAPGYRFQKQTTEHHALADARWVRGTWQELEEIKAR